MYECKLWPILLIFHCICFSLVLCVLFFSLPFLLLHSFLCFSFFRFLCSICSFVVFFSWKLFLSIISSHSLHYQNVTWTADFDGRMADACMRVCLYMWIWMFVLPFMHGNWMLTMMFLWLSFGNSNTVLPFTQRCLYLLDCRCCFCCCFLFLLFTFFFFYSSLAFVCMWVWACICLNVCYATLMCNTQWVYMYVPFGALQTVHRYWQNCV